MKWKLQFRVQGLGYKCSSCSNDCPYSSQYRQHRCFVIDLPSKEPSWAPMQTWLYPSALQKKQTSERRPEKVEFGFRGSGLCMVSLNLQRLVPHIIFFTGQRHSAKGEQIWIAGS